MLSGNNQDKYGVHFDFQLFSAASAAVGVSNTIGLLVGMRVLQAAG